MKISRLLMFTVVSVFALSTYASAEQNPRFASFGEFRQGLDQATLAEYAASRVESPAAFEEMRAHLHDLYDGVHVSHSYEVDGQVFDCIPIMEQPSVRLNGITTIATPPPPSTMDAGDPSEAAQQAVFFDPSQDKDAYGNQRSCEEGSIPMRRITLEEMTRFRTLRGFFNKIPEGLETAPSETAPPSSRLPPCCTSTPMPTSK